MLDLTANRAAALSLTPVSRETAARLDRFVGLLLTWQRTVNLVAPSTLAVLWTRHIADSLQLIRLAPGAITWIDLGSGGGFPGVVLACALAERPGARVHLVESHSRKAAFLQEAARQLQLPVVVHCERIEHFAGAWDGRAEIVTARALAAMPRLLSYATPFLEKGAKALFLKGQDVEAELTQATKSWNITADLVPSVTDPNGRIVVVKSAQPRRTSP